MQKLSIDNPFFNGMSKLGDLILLNVLTLIAALPILTIGAAWTAMYEVLLQWEMGERVSVGAGFVKSFKCHFKRATFLGMLIIGVGAVLIFDLLYMNYLPSFELFQIIGVVVGGLLIVWAIVLSYAFAILPRIEGRSITIIKKALDLGVRNLPITLMMVTLNSIPFLWFVMDAVYVEAMIPIYLIVGFVLVGKINMKYMKSIIL